jgi:hypothetical protein
MLVLDILIEIAMHTKGITGEVWVPWRARQHELKEELERSG